MRPVYVIIGGGTSGIILALQLLEFADVFLIEMGSEMHSQTCKLCQNPLLWTETANCEHCAIKYNTKSQTNLFGRSISIPQGKGLGGSWNINAMIWEPGHQAVFDNYWPKEWSWDILQPHFQKVIELIKPTYMRPEGHMRSILHHACCGKGIYVNASGANVGSGGYCATIDSSIPAVSSSEEEVEKGGRQVRRISLAEHLINRAKSLPGKLTIHTHSKAISLLLSIDGKKVTGAMIRTQISQDVCHEWQANPALGGEVVLCAGAIQTPALLSISGLNKQDSNIGTALRDHTILPIINIGPWWKENRNVVDLKKDSSLEEQNNENTIISSGANGVHGIVQLNSQGEPLPLSSSISSGKDKYEDNVQHPKTQLLLIDGRISPALAPEMLLPLWEKRLIWHSLLRPFFCLLLKFLFGLPPVKWLSSCCFGFLVCNIDPAGSPGSINFPHHHQSKSYSKNGIITRIDPKYNSDISDTIAIKCAISKARLSLSKSSFPWYIELLPGIIPLWIYIPLFTTSYFHLCGSVPLPLQCLSSSTSLSPSSSSSNLDGAVDVRLRLNNIVGLRIADASVFPYLPSSPIGATVMAVAHRAGFLMKEDWENNAHI